MQFIDRFTRDDVSAKVWWPFTMLLLVLLVLTFPGEHRAIEARHRDTAATSAALSRRVIGPLIGSAPAGTITGSLSDQLTQSVGNEILVNDARLRAVRIWAQDGTLLWASTGGERVGQKAALNDQDIAAAVDAGGAPTWITTDKTPDNAPSPTIYYAYSAIGPQPLVAQFDYLDPTLTSDVRLAWLGYQIVLGVGFLLALTFSLLSMREPKARIGTGVPFYPESVPSYLAVMDSDRAVAIEQSGDRIKERVGSLQQKLDESEAARRRAEGQLQQALAALATPGHRMPVPVSEPVVEVTPEVARVPEPVVDRAPEPAVAAPPPPVADEPVPVVAPKAEPAPKPKPRARPTPSPEPAPTPPAPEPVVVAAPPEPPAIERRSEPEPEPVPELAVAAAAADRAEWPEVVVVPELQPAKTTPAPGQESAADMLDRLVEPVGAHDQADEAGDLRARLARTAAIKKPGSKERRELDEQQQRH